MANKDFIGLLERRSTDSRVMDDLEAEVREACIKRFGSISPYVDGVIKEVMRKDVGKNRSVSWVFYKRIRWGRHEQDINLELRGDHVTVSYFNGYFGTRIES